jgi:hypothetical protein
MIIAGERRFRAAKKAKLQLVPVLVKTDTSEPVLAAVQLTENFHREDLTLMEIADGVNAYIAKAEKKITNAELAKLFGRSATYWSRVRKLSGARECIKEAVSKGEMTNLNTISDLISLAAVNSETFEDVWLDMRKGEVSGNIEKYVAGQLSMAKELKTYGFIRPRANEHGIYSEHNEMTVTKSFAGQYVSLVIHTLQVAPNQWAAGHNFKVFDAGNGTGISGEYHSAEEAVIYLAKKAAAMLTIQVESDTTQRSLSDIRRAFCFLNALLKESGSKDVVTMPERPKPPQSCSTATEEAKGSSHTIMGALERAERAKNKEGQTLAKTLVETEENAKKTNEELINGVFSATEEEPSEVDVHNQNDNVVCFQSLKEESNVIATQMLEVPNAIQPLLSRLVGYFYAVNESMGEKVAVSEIQNIVDQCTSAPQSQTH